MFGLDHKIGRQHYGKAGYLIIYFAPNTWPYPPYFDVNSVPALDACTGWYKAGKLDVHGVAGKPYNNNQPDYDEDLTGLAANYTLFDALRPGAYMYELKQTTAPAANRPLDVAGVKANGSFMGFEYSAEFAKNYGHSSTANYTGSALKANLKRGLAGSMGNFMQATYRAQEAGVKAGTFHQAAKSEAGPGAPARPRGRPQVAVPSFPNRPHGRGLRPENNYHGKYRIYSRENGSADAMQSMTMAGQGNRHDLHAEQPRDGEQYPLRRFAETEHQRGQTNAGQDV